MGKIIIPKNQNFTSQKSQEYEDSGTVYIFHGTLSNLENQLRDKLKEFNFNCLSYGDIGKENIKATLLEASNVTYDKYACLMVIMLRQSDEWTKADQDDIIQYFMGKNCYDLIGKPKIFFFQTCRGGNKSIKSIDNLPDIYDEQDAPPEADIFVYNTNDSKFVDNFVHALKKIDYQTNWWNFIGKIHSEKKTEMVISSTLTRMLYLDPLSKKSKMKYKMVENGLTDQNITNEKRLTEEIKKGLMIIFNYEICKTIMGETHKRSGADRDVKLLEETFYELNFDFQKHVDLGKCALLTALESNLSEDGPEYDCIVIAICTIGGDGAYLTMDNPITADEMINVLKSKTKYREKLKILLLQGGREKHGDVIIPNDKPNCLDSNTLLSYSSCDGGVAYRNSRSGSVFIRELCETILKWPTQTIDILSLFTKVARTIAYSGTMSRSHPMKQMPEYISTLTKNYVFVKIPSGNTSNYIISD